MIAFDWGAIGGAIAAIGAVATGAWAWWVKRSETAAKARANVAEANAETTVADAQGALYRLLAERLTTLEAEMQAVRAELNAERQHSRKLEVKAWQLELHVGKLETLMRAAGMEPPTLGVTP